MSGREDSVGSLKVVRPAFLFSISSRHLRVARSVGLLRKKARLYLLVVFLGRGRATASFALWSAHSFPSTSLWSPEVCWYPGGKTCHRLPLRPLQAGHLVGRAAVEERGGREVRVVLRWGGTLLWPVMSVCDRGKQSCIKRHRRCFGSGGAAAIALRAACSGILNKR